MIYRRQTNCLRQLYKWYHKLAMFSYKSNPTYLRKGHETFAGQHFSLLFYLFCGCLKTLHATPRHRQPGSQPALVPATLAIYVLHLLHIRHVGRVQRPRQIDCCCRCSSHFFCGTNNGKSIIYWTLCCTCHCHWT